MNSEFRLMREHGEFAAPAAVDGRLVISSLGYGESEIARRATCLKLLLDGEEVYEIDGETHLLRPGLMLIVPPGAKIRAKVSRRKPSVGICLYLPLGSGDFEGLGVLECSARTMPLASQISRVGSILAQNQEHADRLVPRLVSTAAQAAPKIIANSLATAARLSAVRTSTQTRLLRRAERARAYLDERCDRAVSLQELATAVALSPYALARTFKAAFGEGPASYHRNARLERARIAISRAEASITEAAVSAGYSELSSFTKAYRRRFGRAPSFDK